MYKTNVRPLLTYASETTAETTCTQQLLRTTEMKIIRAIHGETIRAKIRSDQLQQLSGIQEIVKWANVRRNEWDVQGKRMEDSRLAKIGRDNRPQGVRSGGRPKKRWNESLNTTPSLVRTGGRPKKLWKETLNTATSPVRSTERPKKRWKESLSIAPSSVRDPGRPKKRCKESNSIAPSSIRSQDRPKKRWKESLSIAT
jgi:hypothetical protein